jgi:hypothetical protein
MNDVGQPRSATTCLLRILVVVGGVLSQAHQRVHGVKVRGARASLDELATESLATAFPVALLVTLDTDTALASAFPSSLVTELDDVAQPRSATTCLNRILDITGGGRLQVHQ